MRQRTARRAPARLLNPFSVESVSGCNGPSGGAQYVRVRMGRPEGTRQALAGLLWPERDESHARQSLRQALTALRYARAQLRVERWEEEAHRQVIRLPALGGARNAALAHYRRMRTLLAEELGVEPEEASRSLHEAIRAGRERSAGAEQVAHSSPWDARACRPLRGGVPGSGARSAGRPGRSCVASPGVYGHGVRSAAAAWPVRA